MPGEQLTCVVHLAYERYGESLLHRRAIYQALVDINWDRYSCLTKEDFFPCSTKVKFSKLKTFILKRNINITEKELGEKTLKKPAGISANICTLRVHLGRLKYTNSGGFLSVLQMKIHIPLC